MLICCWKQVSWFHSVIFIIFGVSDVLLLVTWKISERKFWRGDLFYHWAKPLFEEIVWKVHLNTFYSAHCLSWVKNTPGFFNKEWIDEENKAVFILIRHWKSFKRLSSLGNDVCHLNWLGIRPGFVCQQHLWARKDILHGVLHVSGTDLRV